MKRRTGSKIPRQILVFLMLWMGTAALSSALAAYVILPDNTRVDGTEIRAKSDGEIILTTAQGQRSFFKGQYLKAVADKPPELDQAKALAAAKNYDEAIKILNDIALKYRLLEWDNTARTLIAQIYVSKGDYQAAVDAFENMFRAAPEARSNPATLRAYQEALLSAKLYDKLGPMLDETISKGARPEAARAQIMRGDIKSSQGNIEAAVLDYLRTVILFESEKEQQPEALYKAAQSLEQLRDPRAKNLYAKIVSEYPSSPYAAEAKQKQ